MKKYLAQTILLTAAFTGTVACNGTSRMNVATPSQANGTSPTSGTSQVTLNWSANKGEQQGFYIEESTDGVNFTQILIVPDGTTTAQVTLASQQQQTSFRVRGYNQAGVSPYSGVVSVQ